MTQLVRVLAGRLARGMGSLVSLHACRRATEPLLVVAVGRANRCLLWRMVVPPMAHRCLGRADGWAKNLWRLAVPARAQNGRGGERSLEPVGGQADSWRLEFPRAEKRFPEEWRVGKSILVCRGGWRVPAHTCLRRAGGAKNAPLGFRVEFADRILILRATLRPRFMILPQCDTRLPKVAHRISSLDGKAGNLDVILGRTMHEG